MVPWDDDPQLVVEMAVCEYYRVPHSEFLRWDEQDRAKAIWYRSRQLGICPSCGIPPEKAREYEPQITVFPCCQKRERAEEELSKRPRMERARGARVIMTKPAEGGTA